MRYFIADCHFFHNSLNTQMDRRGFSSREEMNDYMIYKWNSRVRPSDEVVILGDLCVGSSDEAAWLLSQLNGKLCLIRGNHDYFGRKRGYPTNRFLWIRDYAEIKDNHRLLVLCHYPILFYNGQYKVKAPKLGGMDQIMPTELPTRDQRPPTSYMLYGHVHNSTDEDLIQEFILRTRSTVKTDDRTGEVYHIPSQMINCFCMFSDYVPLSIDEWIENDRVRREKWRKERGL